MNEFDNNKVTRQPDEELDYGSVLASEEDQYLNDEVFCGTPETRKNWDVEDWKYGIRWKPDLISEKDCPIDHFSAEDWKEIILESDPIVVQYCPCPNDVLAVLTKEDFENYDSWQICETLVLEGEWLAPLMPLEKIEQQDFDDCLVCDADEYRSEEEFFSLVGTRFPDCKIPDHLNWPFKGKSRKQ